MNDDVLSPLRIEKYEQQYEALESKYESRYELVGAKYENRFNRLESHFANEAADCIFSEF
jgi:hypothetical protein